MSREPVGVGGLVILLCMAAAGTVVVGLYMGVVGAIAWTVAGWLL